MKITKQQLRRIIKEEKARLLEMQPPPARGNPLPKVSAQRQAEAVEEIEAILNELFDDNENSIRASYLRVSIGSSDLDEYPFSYNDLPNGQTDVEMNNFDCEHYYEKADIDNYSKISLKDELLVNHDYGNFYKSLSLKVSQINGKDIVKNFIKNVIEKFIIQNSLTQFLLRTGQNLIGGESAGGTKLQELVGATKKPLELSLIHI